MLIFVLCVVSAVLGRLLLTRDQAWRTVTVRLPALFQFVVLAVCAVVFWLVYGILCFIGGSFYGLGQWWWPQLFEVLEGNGELIGPIITGKWND